MSCEEDWWSKAVKLQLGLLMLCDLFPAHDKVPSPIPAIQALADHQHNRTPCYKEHVLLPSPVGISSLALPLPSSSFTRVNYALHGAGYHGCCTNPALSWCYNYIAIQPVGAVCMGGTHGSSQGNATEPSSELGPSANLQEGFCLRSRCTC